MSRKPVRKREPKKKQPQKKPGELPTFKSPAKTTWGKIVILIIAAAMVLIPLIGLIVMLATR
ncbi:MAG: hypothetical protein GX149_01975 [Acholeplasmataceae bacterium]|jgi:hypothetical protein|nr:hypothetical protein [Acholeplasmataceae bacterium]